MKIKYLLLISGLFISNFCFSQDYLDEIASKTCACLELLPEELKGEELSMQLGLCLLEEAKNYKVELLKDHQIDFDKIDKQGAELGRIVGVKMVSICPKVFTRLVEEEDDITEETDEFIAEGKISNITDDSFVVFSLKNDEGKTARFYWLISVATEIDLAFEYKKLNNERVRISYIIQELFDPKILEYRNYNIITSLDLLEP